MAFKTLQVHHFAQLPKEAEQNINGIIQDITPYDTLYEGSCDEIKVYGPDDMQLMGKAMYNEAKRELMKEAVTIDTRLAIWNGEDFKCALWNILTSYGVIDGGKFKMIIIKGDGK